MVEVKYEEMPLNEAEETIEFIERPEDIDTIQKVYTKYDDTEWEFSGYVIIYTDGLVSQMNEEQCCNVADIDLNKLLKLFKKD